MSDTDTQDVTDEVIDLEDLDDEVEETEDDEETMPSTPKELALELDIDPKTLRGFLRKEFPRAKGEVNTSWKLTEEHVLAAREHFLEDDEDDTDEDVEDTDSDES